ncbi:TonB-dependent receptor plug domain-containing protein [Lentisalinibacter sediminis]|uniref:TonB-dependent receptor plug domain-containing protein n=1 Tax=Lentisalinibacter sediminis TaxID=2992237 RepID=UPI00386BED08
MVATSIFPAGESAWRNAAAAPACDQPPRAGAGRVRIAPGWLALGVLVCSASATADEFDATVYELGELIVTAEQPRVVEEVSTLDEITAEDIQRAGARTLDQALELLPGLYIRNETNGTPRIDVRGLRTRNVLLLLDGVPLNSTFDGQFDPAGIPVENIARIKFTRGVSSVLYGPGGNGGVINIVTRNASDEPAGYLLAEHQFEDEWQARGRFSLRSDKLSWFVSGSARDREHWVLPDDFEPTSLQPGEERVNSDRRDEALYSSLTYQFADRTSAGLSIGYNAGEYGRPPAVTPRNESPFVRRIRYEQVDYDALTTQLVARHALNDTLSVRPALFHNRRNEVTDGFDDTSYASQDAAGAFHEDATTTIGGGSIQAVFDTATLGLATISVSGRRENWDASGFTLEGGGGGGGGGGGDTVTRTPLDEEHDVDIYSVAAEWERHFSTDFSGVAGFSWNRQARDDAGNEEGWSYLLGARYAFTEDTRIRGSYARQIRFPTLRDLYEIDRGNPALEPENTDNFELALERDLRNGRSGAELVLYRVEAKDFIARGPSGLAENYDELRFQGFELNGRHSVGGNLEFRLGYTFLDSENQGEAAETSELQNRPEHKLSVRLDYDWRPDTRLYAAYLYVADALALSRGTPVETTEVGDYQVVDIGVSHLLRSQRLRVIGRIENLFDEEYQESFGYPRPGRQIYLGAEVRL